MTAQFKHFGIIGAGAWGTAIAAVLGRAGCRVSMWAHEADVAAAINERHENTTYLKGVTLHPDVKATHDLTGVASCDAWIMATPAQHTRELAKKLAPLAGTAAQPVIIASKGIEQKNSILLSDVIATELTQHAVAILSGPSFAIEVARGLPTALTFAIADQALGKILIQAMAAPAFRLYLTDDMTGAQLGGAIKNVLAVACGIVAGRQMGENARAALITRGLAEMMRLGIAMGARAETLMGLSGLGDLVLTCSSTQSRNMSLGMALGQGQKLADILGSRASVTEGVHTAAGAWTLAQKHKVEMPIVAAINAVLNKGADIDSIIAGLLARPLKQE